METTLTQNETGSYDAIAEWYISARSPVAGIKDVEAFIDTLPPNATVLELGCGDGIPLSRLVIQKNHRLFAIDNSAKMVNKFRCNFPGIVAKCAPIQDTVFFSTSFDAVIAWGVLSHLLCCEQEAVIKHAAKCLKPGGRLFFTAQKEIINGVCTMDGVDFPYVSLGNQSYTSILKQSGMRLADEHFDRWGNYLYIADKYSTR